MITLTIEDRKGNRQPVEIPEGINLSLMEVLKAAEHHILATCGGMALCAEARGASHCVRHHLVLAGSSTGCPDALGRGHQRPSNVFSVRRVDPGGQLGHSYGPVR